MAKNIIRKILPMIGGIGIVAASASTVVSCTSPQYAAGNDGERVVVATDGGHVNDNSFNQDAYIGVKKFVKDQYDLDGKNNYVEAGGSDNTSIISGYRMSVVKKANAVVLPGFSHMNTLPQMVDEFRKYHINSVLVDGTVVDPSVISIQFNSQIAGFMAGYDTSFLAGTNKAKYDVNNDGYIRIGTFAGAHNKYGVDNYMWGLLLGMQVYDDVLATNKASSKPDDWTKNAVPVYSANIAGGNIKDIPALKDSDPDWWTGSFALGDATKMGMTAKLIDDKGLSSIGGADIIFPVAGPQIQDVLTYKQGSGKAPYVIGVDVDQEQAYSDYKGRFITSAIKNIDTAVPEALQRAEMSDATAKSYKLDAPITNSLIDPKTGEAFTAGKGSNVGFTDNDKWLGTSPNQFVNWSIDFTDKDTPTDQGQGRYLLQQHYIQLYDQNNLQTVATGAMDEINTYFASLGGSGASGGTIAASSYMNGSIIYKFADKLVQEYGFNTTTVGNDKDVLNWFGVTPKTPTNN